MKKSILNFVNFLSALAVITGAAVATQAPNPRSTPQRDDISEAKRPAADAVSRTANRRILVTPSNQGVVSNRAAIRQPVNLDRPDAISARSATVPTTARSAMQSQTVRSAAPKSATVSRAASARATAVFDDISKIGGGYASCRESYSTCMDQFCAKANDTYRRCFCSSKFTEFRDTEAALDRAKTLLMRFEDNSLNAVDKTAAEVNAMYSATVGEAAIKNDTSAAQSVLNEIGDLLSGKKKADNSIRSLSGLSIDFSSDIGDIWGDNGVSDIFGSSSMSNISQLEGQALYNAVDKQCTEIARSACDSNAVFTMAKSSYGILITQDCNLYEKKIGAQKEAVTKTVRQAEKILREARLEEYRAHNSSDVNECVTQVKKAITGDNACGADYKRCLDYTGIYIDAKTGEPIYSPQLFKLTEMLNLNNTNGNPVSTNPRFNAFLDGKKIFAETALDTCRSKAAIVWDEFKRSAMIEIAQAQDAKIEEIKSSCVDTMAECYDTQSGALASFDNTKSQATGALNAYASRAMCADKVAACAALYAGPNDVRCEFDSNGRLRNSQCGLSSLLSFVQTVDNYKVAEGCEVGLRNFVQSTCAPAAGDTHEVPWGCRLMGKGVSDNYANGSSPRSIGGLLQKFALDNCTDPSVPRPNSYNEWNDSTIKTMVDTTLRKILEDIDYVMYDECEEAQGLWVMVDELSTTDKPEQAFYVSAFAGRTPDIATKATNDAAGTSWGYCVQNTVMYQCIAQDEATGNNGYAVFNPANNTCSFKEEWYQIKCEGLGGYYEGGVCYV